MFLASPGDVGVKSRRCIFVLSAGIESKVLTDARCYMEMRKYRQSLQMGIIKHSVLVS